MKPMPTVVHVVHSLLGGGTERSLIALLGDFDPHSFRHLVVTLRGPGELAGTLPAQVACRPLGTVGRSYSVGMRLGRILRRVRADVIHARNTGCWSDTLIAGLMNPGVQVVLGFHGLDHAGAFPRRSRWVARCAERLGADFAAATHSGRLRLIEGCRVSPERIQILPTGVDVGRFGAREDVAKPAARKYFGFNSDAIVVGTVAGLTPVKRHDILIDAFAPLARMEPRLRLLMVGEGLLRNDLERRVAEQQVAGQVVFAGRREDVPAILPAIDIYVCSSDSEELSNSMLEAAACGIPVMTTNVGDHGIVIRDGVEGLVIAPNDTKALRQALQFLVSHPAERSRFGDAARRRAVDFDIGDARVRYAEFYARIVSRRIRGAAPPTIWFRDPNRPCV